MDRDQLAAFEGIAREGSFTRAAVALRIGQPAVSARIRALEEQLGGALFTRGRRVALTALGESFLPFARRALEILAEGVEASRLAQTGQRGRIRVGTLASLAGGLVGPALGRFLRRHPAVECVVRAGDHERIVGLLLDGLVDVGLVTWPCAEAGAAHLQPVLHLREPVVLVAAAVHPLARRGRITQDELARSGTPLVRLRWWQEHHPAIDRLAARTRPPLELPMEAARSLVLAGEAVGFFTRTYVSEDLERGGLAPVEVADMPRLHRDAALVRRARAAPLSAATAALVEAVRVQAAALGLAQRRRHLPASARSS